MVIQATGWWSPVGPLTTVFTPPASCLQDLYYDVSTPTVTLGIFEEKPECYPTRYWEDFWGSGIGYYSPAICPSGYTSACGRQTSNDNGPGYTVGPLVTSGETAVKCCPSNYVCHPTLEFYCSSKIAKETIATAGEGGRTTTVGTDAAAHAFGIQVRYQSSDLSVLALAGFGSTATSDSPPITSPPQITTTSVSGGRSAITTSSTSTPLSTSSSSSGLPQGAKIGIGVSIPLVVAILALLAFLFLRRRKKASPVEGSSTFRGVPELQNTGVHPLPELADEKQNSYQHVQPVHHKHPSYAVVETDSSNIQPNLYHTQPSIHPHTFSQPVEAPSTATSPTVFEVGSSDYRQTEVNELPGESIRGEHNTHPNLGNIPATYGLGGQTATFDSTDIKATTAVTGAGDSTEVNEEITYLETQQEKIRIKRERLKQLEEIDEEESRIQEKLARLKNSQG